MEIIISAESRTRQGHVIGVARTIIALLYSGDTTQAKAAASRAMPEVELLRGQDRAEFLEGFHEAAGVIETTNHIGRG